MRVSRLGLRAQGGQWKAAGKYLVRTQENAFGPNGTVADPGALTREWYDAGDTVLYKVVISPESSAGLDLPDITRSAMHRASAEMREYPGLKGDLEWVAAAHYDSDHPHVHVAIRGRAGGQRFALNHAHMAKRLRRHVHNLSLERRLNRVPGKTIPGLSGLSGQPKMGRSKRGDQGQR